MFARQYRTANDARAQLRKLRAPRLAPENNKRRDRLMTMSREYQERK